MTSDLERFFLTASPDELDIFRRQGGQLPASIVRSRASRSATATEAARPQTAKERRRAIRDAARERLEKEA